MRYQYRKQSAGLWALRVKFQTLSFLAVAAYRILISSLFSNLPIYSILLRILFSIPN